MFNVVGSLSMLAIHCLSFSHYDISRFMYNTISQCTDWMFIGGGDHGGLVGNQISHVMLNDCALSA